MTYTDVIVLIPSHSLEDFPTEQGEVPAAGLLNSFAVAWHPQWLARMAQLPRWHRADDPPHPAPGQLVFVPAVTDGWLPHDWVAQARAAEVVVIDQVHERAEMLSQALAPLEPLTLAPDLVDDFLALGTCWLQVELLTRHMRNFGNIDEIRFQNRVIAAARAVVADDRETAEAHLKASFEILLEAREQFYPVDCYLLDLCLVIADTADEELTKVAEHPSPTNILLTGHDLQTIQDRRPDIVQALKDGLEGGRLGLIGGEDEEIPIPVMPVGSWLHQLSRGRQVYGDLLGTAPRVWGRRRFGLFPTWPQVLKNWDYVGVLHVALDDGIYPDDEHSRVRWQGCDQTIIEAFSRIPLAAESATSWLRFPVRMAESMDHDHVAAVCFARWPGLRAPWLSDLQRAEKYAPVLGKFVTFEQLFTTNSAPGRLVNHQGGQYFAPFLLQHVARRETNPISRYADHLQRRLKFDAVNWCRGMAAVLRNVSKFSAEAEELERDVERSGPDSTDHEHQVRVDRSLDVAMTTWSKDLASIIMQRATVSTAGQLLLNPYRFSRRMTLPWQGSPPAVSGCVKGFDPGPVAGTGSVTVDVPGCGFVWLTNSQPGANARPAVKESRVSPAAEAGILVNERLEIVFNEDTAGIAHVRHPRRRENRFSQLVAFRYPRERQLPAQDDQPPEKSQYAETRLLRWEPMQDLGAVQELTAWGEIVDQLTGDKLASFRQTTRLFRHRNAVELDVELDDVRVPEGDPWNNYFCTRFAWDSSSAVVTRSLLGGAQPTGGDRFETTEYIEIASEDERLTIIPHGLPFHRKTGPRMLDSILIVEGETRRRFSFTVVLDHAYPLEAAWDVLAPVLSVPTETGFRESLTSGWLVHCDARNVQILNFLDLMTAPPEDEGPRPPEGSSGFAVRLMETEGRPRTVKLKTFRAPIFARRRDFLGRTLGPVLLENDGISMEIRGYEIADLELVFG